MQFADHFLCLLLVLTGNPDLETIKTAYIFVLAQMSSCGLVNSFEECTLYFTKYMGKKNMVPVSPVRTSG